MDIENFDALAWIAISVFILFGAFCVLGTILDVTNRLSAARDLLVGNNQNREQYHGMEDTQTSNSSTTLKNLVERCGFVGRFLVSFSWLSNGEALLDTTQRPGTLTCLHGIRTLSMTWIVLGHSQMLIKNFPLANTADYYKAQDRIPYQVLTTMDLGVDTFLVLSAVLVTYLTIKQLQRGSLNWAYFYFHRFWRLSPVYWLLVLLVAGLYRQLLGGSDVGSDCIKHGWINILYINNYYKIKCMFWTWYLGMDMQYYIISPIFIILLLRYLSLGYAALALGILLPVGSTFGLAWHYGFYIYDPMRITNSVANQYISFHGYCRCAPYVVGIFTGYLLMKGGGRVQMSKVTVCVGWCVAIVFGLFVVYGVSYYHYFGEESPLIFSAIFTSIHRLLWALAVAWVIIACHSGYGGFINTMLSWSAWIPLSRLTYSCYLVHPIVITYYQEHLKTTFYFDIVNLIYFFLGNLVLGLLLAVVLVLSIEMPFLSLEKLLFPCFTKKKSPAVQPSERAHLDKYGTFEKQ